MQSHFTKSSVLFKCTYVTPIQTIKRIKNMKHICSMGPYLECVVEYAEVSKITTEFSELHKLPKIADPDEFTKYYYESLIK